MTRQKIVGVWVGGFVLFALASLVVIALKVSNFEGLSDKPTYQVNALFSNIGGLKERSPVKISSVVVGRVEKITVDPVTYQARVTMNIDTEFNELPIDTSASILTSGLLGDQYIGLTPGADDLYLTEGSQIDLVQPALVLEELIGQFITKFSNSGE